MKGKRGQAATIAVVLLLVIVIILIVASIVVILLNPSIINPQPIIIKTVQDTSSQQTFVCNYPYIRLGNTCCLDNNHNGICDIDEKQQQYNAASCYRPYIQEGTTCCLDENDNGICDYDDYRRHYYRNRHSRSYGSSYLDFPFEINDLEIRNSEIWIRISNIGDYDYIIKSIDIEGCDKINPDTMIYEGDDRDFTIDCPDDISNRDVIIEYKRSSSYSTSTSHGRIRK